MEGIIYLIQPNVLKGTNRYKVGMSKDQTPKRINSYGSKTKIISIKKCIDPFDLEKKIINEFNKKFKLIDGKEYFEGDENEMIDLFEQICYKNRKTSNHKDNSENDSEFDIINKSDNNTTEDNDDFTDSDNSFEQENKVYTIDNYYDFIKHAKISKIIITDNKTLDGYYTFDYNFWIKLHSVKKISYNIETLNSVIEHYSNSSSSDEFYKIYNDNIISIDQFHKNPNKYKYNYKFLCVKFNTKRIKKSILSNCYNPNPILFKLKYNEYFFSVNGNYKIFNSKYKTFNNLSDYKERGILLEKNYVPSFGNKDLSNINTTIVDDILYYLIDDDTVFIKLKQFVKNMFVENKYYGENIFYDYDDTGYFLITEWLVCLLRKIGENYSFYKGDIKEINEKNPKLVIIKHSYHDDKYINELSDIGIKNIIVTQKNKHNSFYENYNNFFNYLNNKTDEIQKYVSRNLSDKKIQHYEDIFRCGDLLALNFFIWCCED